MSSTLSDNPRPHAQDATVQDPELGAALNASQLAMVPGEQRAESGSHCESVATASELEALADNYESVRDCLYHLPRDCSDRTRAENLSLIGILGRQDNISAVFRDILNDTTLLSEIARRSYHHTNHFDKIVLVDTGTQLGYRLTLHLWTPPYSEQEVNDEQIHDHRFSFWSSILVGNIIFQNYVRYASGVMFKEYQYIPERLGVSTVGNYYIDVGESPLLEMERSGGNAGEFYHLTYNRIHRVVLPRTEMSCTLVLRGPRQKNYASVFSNSQKYDPSGNTMFSPESVAEKLSMVLDGIERRNS